ncbi:DUF1073 domain-containing protein [Sphingobium sp. BS19]|uniref:phage portal protein n=1 Tax=Sphingobium sp. BS19 TaxID=3018973 RepID=UPI0022EDA65F|nr:DUF1073 domain-containing protein [Sphingobium sp. BS19]GLI99140.1 hypothetical protein Sbs19_29580 [Sphingobium sp. BS19]
MSSPPARIRSVRFKDGLTSAITGLGTNLDPRNSMQYAPSFMTQDMIDAAYRGSGMMRRVIDLPPLDMVREWRNWQAEQDQIKLLEAEERRLDLRGKVRLAETLRGLGGGAFILGLPGAPETPAPANIPAKGLAYIHVVSRYQLTLGPIVEDHTDPAFGGPKHFTLTTTTGQKDIHPSRVVAFRGDAIPLLRMTGWEEQYWGESRVARVYEAVRNSDSAQGHFAALIGKVRNTIIGIPDLAGLLAEPDGEQVLQTRISAMILGESMFNATLRDAGDGTAGAGETIDHRQINWAGIPDIMMAFATFIGAVAGMPATLVIGKSPDGQNATGKGDADNWNATVRARQTLELGPCMDQVDKYLIPSAGVTPTADAEIWSEWAPLSVPSAKEQADTFFATMQAVEKVQATGAIPDEAFAKGFQNLMSEKGWIPGLEGALAELPEDERFGITPDASNDDDPSAIQSKGGDPVSQGTGGASGSDVPLRRAANDALRATGLSDEAIADVMAMIDAGA